jgi:hypothetical protein
MALLPALHGGSARLQQPEPVGNRAPYPCAWCWLLQPYTRVTVFDEVLCSADPMHIYVICAKVNCEYANIE